MVYITSFLLAMVVTMAWMPLCARIAPRLRIVDHPDSRKVHAAPIPRIGGIAMALGVSFAAMLVVPIDSADRNFLLAAGILTVFGALDDRFNLNYKTKLLGQLIAAGIVVFSGDVQIQALTLDDRLVLPQWISIPLSMAFLVGITNAINLADGLDGLAGGTTFLSLCALAILAYSAGQVSSAALTLCFAGAALGFLRFNTFPASIFMGDAGSQLLGFAVGVLSVRATQNGGTVVSAATPALLLALPILDTLSVMVQRISEGRSPFSADKNHIHHKLLALGFSHHEAVMVIYAVQADLFLLAYWMRYESDLAILGAVSVFFIGALLLLHLAAKRQWRWRSPAGTEHDSPPARVLALLLQPQYVPRWSYLAVVFALGAYAALVMSEIAGVSGDVKLLILTLLAVTASCLVILRVGPLSLLEKGTLYVTVAALVYLDSIMTQGDRVTSILGWGIVLIAAAGTLLRLRLTGERRFELTPLDIIVLFVALVVPSLPGNLGLLHGGALAIAKLVILFYAVEVLATRVDAKAVWLRIGVAAVLTGLVLKPML